MKRCMSVLAPMFNTNRMVQEYAEKLYLPALKRARVLWADNLKASVELAHQKDRLRGQWPNLRVEDITADTQQKLGVRTPLDVRVVARLGDLKPQEVRVQLYAGKLDNDGCITEPQALDLAHNKDLGDGRHEFMGRLTPSNSGRHGFAVRIVPGGMMFEGICEPGLIFWDRARRAPPGLGAAHRRRHRGVIVRNCG